MKLLFVIGYQKYFIDKVLKDDPIRMEYLTAAFDNFDNHITIINWALRQSEYEEGLPECILEDERQSTFIPEEGIQRALLVPNLTAIIHRKSKKIFEKTNPNIHEVLFKTLEVIDGMEKTIDEVAIYNLTDDLEDASNLVDGLKEFSDRFNDCKFSIH